MNYISKHFKLKEFCSYDSVRVCYDLFELSSSGDICNRHEISFDGLLEINVWSSSRVVHCIDCSYVYYSSFGLICSEKGHYKLKEFLNDCTFKIYPCKIVLFEKCTLYKNNHNA